MPTKAVVTSTPHYVLLDGNRCIGPKVVALRSGMECSTIYGFSSRGPYGKFCRNSEPGLTPYPLVKVYLRSQVGAPGDSLQLVVVDAAGPRVPYLQAAAMQAVLEALENRTNYVTAAYRLMFDEEISAYRVEEASV